MATGPNLMVGSGFRSVIILTTVLIFVLITVGGIVRLTGSGLGCPDWPMCHGKIIPPLDKATLIEYSHRLMATIVALFIIGITSYAWIRYRSYTLLRTCMTLGLGLLILQVILGGITVLNELPDYMVLAHLAVAEALIATFVVACLASFSNSSFVKGANSFRKPRTWVSLYIFIAIVLVYGLMLAGSYVSVSGATAACGQSWPFCQGHVFPSGEHMAIHMAHRYITLIVGIVILGLLLISWALRYQNKSLLILSSVICGLFVIQSFVGALIMWSDFILVFRLTHLSMATLMWMGLVCLAAIWFINRKFYNIRENGNYGP